MTSSKKITAAFVAAALLAGCNNQTSEPAPDAPPSATPTPAKTASEGPTTIEFGAQVLVLTDGWSAARLRGPKTVTVSWPGGESTAALQPITDANDVQVLVDEHPQQVGAALSHTILLGKRASCIEGQCSSSAGIFSADVIADATRDPNMGPVLAAHGVEAALYAATVTVPVDASPLRAQLGDSTSRLVSNTRVTDAPAETDALYAVAYSYGRTIDAQPLWEYGAQPMLPREDLDRLDADRVLAELVKDQLAFDGTDPEPVLAHASGEDPLSYVTALSMGCYGFRCTADPVAIETELLTHVLQPLCSPEHGDTTLVLREDRIVYDYASPTYQAFANPEGVHIKYGSDDAHVPFFIERPETIRRVTGWYVNETGIYDLAIIGWNVLSPEGSAARVTVDKDEAVRLASLDGNSPGPC